MRKTFKNATIVVVSALAAAAFSMSNAAALNVEVKPTQPPFKNLGDQTNNPTAEKVVPHADVHIGCYENKLTMSVEDEEFRERLGLACRLINGFLMPPQTPQVEKVRSYLTAGYVNRLGNEDLLNHFKQTLKPAVYEVTSLDNYNKVLDSLTLDLNVGGQVTFYYVQTVVGIRIAQINYR